MSPQEQEAAHPVTRAFCHEGSALAGMVVGFVNGTDLQHLLLLAFHIGRLWWAPTSERSVQTFCHNFCSGAFFRAGNAPQIGVLDFICLSLSLSLSLSARNFLGV